MDIILKILSLIKTIVFNLKYIPLNQAIYCPIKVHFNFKVYKMKGRIILNFDYKRRKVVLGYGGSPALQSMKGGIWLDDNSSLIFSGDTCIGQGTVIRCDKDAEMVIGNNFYCNKNNYFRNSCKIIIGDNCSFGWNNTFNTCDGHYIGSKNNLSLGESPIIIGNHVWITTHCNLLKGSDIKDNSIVSTASLVCKSFCKNHVLIGGIPATIIKENIYWEK